VEGDSRVEIDASAAESLVAHHRDVDLAVVGYPGVVVEVELLEGVVALREPAGVEAVDCGYVSVPAERPVGCVDSGDDTGVVSLDHPMCQGLCTEDELVPRLQTCHVSEHKLGEPDVASHVLEAAEAADFTRKVLSCHVGASIVDDKLLGLDIGRPGVRERSRVDLEDNVRVVRLLDHPELAHVVVAEEHVAVAKFDYGRSLVRPVGGIQAELSVHLIAVEPYPRGIAHRH